MKKYVAICTTLAALAWVGVAAAATPQGKLTGDGVAITGGGSGTFGLFIITPVIDGGTSFVGLENDNSGNCNGDSGTITADIITAPVVCAHYVASSRCCNAGSPKMRLAYENTPGSYIVVRITDNGVTDNIGFGTVLTTFAQARKWVNRGLQGGGFASTPWLFLPLLGGGDYTITASQT